MSYKLYEHEKVEKFLYKHKNDKKLLQRINKKIMEILKNPHHPNFKELKSNKCPNVKEQRQGNIGLFFMYPK